MEDTIKELLHAADAVLSSLDDTTPKSFIRSKRKALDRAIDRMWRAVIQDKLR